MCYTCTYNRDRERHILSSKQRDPNPHKDSLLRGSGRTRRARFGRQLFGSAHAYQEFTKGGLVKGGLAIHVLSLCLYC